MRNNELKMCMRLNPLRRTKVTIC